jgi:hypothetical protein
MTLNRMMYRRMTLNRIAFTFNKMTLSKVRSHGFAVTLLNIVPGNAKLPNVVLPNVAVLNVVSPEKNQKSSILFFFLLGWP